MKVGARAENNWTKVISRVVLITLVVSFVKPAPSPAAEKLVVVNSALNMLTVPLWVAKEKGYFYKYGIDVDTISQKGA